MLCLPILRQVPAPFSFAEIHGVVSAVPVWLTWEDSVPGWEGVTPWHTCAVTGLGAAWRAAVSGTPGGREGDRLGRVVVKGEVCKRWQQLVDLLLLGPTGMQVQMKYFQ